MQNAYYPRWVTLPEGNKRVVQNNIEHGNVLGKKFNEQAEEIPTGPPDLETVLKAGYSQQAAEGIVATEKAKAEQGIKPYGSKSIEEFVPPPKVAVEPTPDPPTTEPVPVIPATENHPAVFKGEDGKLTIGKRPNLKPPVK